MPFFPSALAGAVQQAVTSPAPQQPTQNLPPNWQDILQKLSGLWGAQGQLQPAAFRAATLRQDKPYNAKGSGPLGIRIGEGPGGWAVSIGDLVAGLHGRKLQDEADARAQVAMTASSKAAGDYASEKLKYPVAQGAPVSGLFGL